jgi:hypothetical protein
MRRIQSSKRKSASTQLPVQGVLQSAVEGVRLDTLFCIRDGIAGAFSGYQPARPNRSSFGSFSFTLSIISLFQGLQKSSPAQRSTYTRAQQFRLGCALPFAFILAHQHAPTDHDAWFDYG